MFSKRRLEGGGKTSGFSIFLESGPEIISMDRRRLKAKIQITASASKNYKAAKAKTITLTIRVK